MPKYSYQAINENGNTITGSVESDSIEMAKSIIASKGYIPSKVVEEGEGALNFDLDTIKEKFSRVTPPELILFTKQFRTMLKAGISILNILQTLENQSENLKVKKIAATMAADIREGSTLYDAFRKHPDVFSPLYCGLMRAGEGSGALPEILDRLTYIIEHEHKVKTEIKAALQYPIIVVAFLGVAFFVLLTFVIPKFARIFVQAGIALPLPTKICMVMYDYLANYWYLMLAAVIGTVVGLAQLFKTEKGKFIRDSFLLKLPILGILFVKATMSRFASIFAILQASGVSVLESMNILTGIIGNAAIAREFKFIKERLEGGRGIAGPLEDAQFFPPMVINMVAIGEESGRLDEMLQEISQHYDYEVEYATKSLSDAIGPLLTVGLAAVVGFFALAIFLPMWDLTKMVQ